MTSSLLDQQQPRTSFVSGLCNFCLVAVIITLHFLIEYFTFCTARLRDEKLVKQALYTAQFHAISDNLTVDKTSGYATWFTAGGAIHITHYDVITRKL